MSLYRILHLIITGIGAIAAASFMTLYAVFDRPKYRDRYAGLLLGLGIVAFLGFSIPFAIGFFIEIEEPADPWRWILAIFLRGLTSAFMVWLLWVYLTPGRAKLRLGRIKVDHLESGE